MGKLTWSDQIAIAQGNAGLSDSTTLTNLKRDMNTGAAKFTQQLGREYNRKSRFTDVVAGQQYYQLPQDGHRIKELVVSTGSWLPPMEQIPDEFAWRMMNMLSIQGIPTHYFIRGYNEFGLYPTPSMTVTEGIEAVFSPRHTNMTELDTITVASVTQNSTTITSTANPFTAKMANLGQWIQITDGSDENWYQIATYTNAGQITINNKYQGPSGINLACRIGQVMDNIPDEFLEAPCDYAAMRFYLKRGIIGLGQVQYFQNMFDTALQAAKDEYGQASESQVISAEPRFRIYNPWRGDSPPHISA